MAFTKSNFLFFIVLLNSVIFYHSLLEILSSLGFENIALLLLLLYHPALLVIPLLVELWMAAYAKGSIFGLPSISRLFFSVSPVLMALNTTYTLMTPNTYISPTLLFKCQMHAYLTHSAGCLRDISSSTWWKLDSKYALIQNLLYRQLS